MDYESFSYIPDDTEKYNKELIKNVQIFKAGEYRGKKWTKDIVKKIVDNFKKLKKIADFEPPVRIGHRSGNSVENAKSVIGYINNLKSNDNGDLYADMNITEEEGLKKIKDTTLRKRSIEIGPYETNKGEIFNEVLWGVGWVDIPQVEKLAEVKVYSKLLEEDKMDKEKYDALVNEANELMANKEASKELLKKCVSSLKQLMTSKIKDEKFYDVSMISNFISSLTNKVEDMMDKKDEKKDEKDDSGDKSETKEDDSKDKSDEGEENATDKGGEGAPEEDKKESEQLDKHDELVQLDKTQYEKLLSYEKQVNELKVAQKVSKIDSFCKEAKIVSAMMDVEKEFALSLTDEQFEKYVQLKTDQPSFVDLDKEQGEQNSTEPKTEEQTTAVDEAKAVEIAERVTAPYNTEVK